ncbi:hypothetical protein ES705_44345 [subsurface metagenome]
MIKQNLKVKSYAGGRNDKMNNLFGHLAICINCGYPMQLLNKGKPPKGGLRLKCDKEIRKINGGCSAKAINYDLVEKNILMYCKGLDVFKISPKDPKRISERSVLQNRQQEIDGELEGIEGRHQNLSESLEYTTVEGTRKTIVKSMDTLTAKQKNLAQEKQENQLRIEEITSSKKNTKEQLKNVQELIDKMKELEGQEWIDLRINLRNQLRRLIRKIIITKVAAFIYFKSGQVRMVSFSDDVNFEKILDSFPPEDMKLAKEGKLSDHVELQRLYRTRYKKRKSA